MIINFLKFSSTDLLYLQSVRRAACTDWSYQGKDFYTYKLIYGRTILQRWSGKCKSMSYENVINPSSNDKLFPNWKHLQETSATEKLKILWEREKMLVTSIVSFFQQCSLKASYTGLSSEDHNCRNELNMSLKWWFLSLKGLRTL